MQGGAFIYIYLYCMNILLYSLYIVQKGNEEVSSWIILQFVIQSVSNINEGTCFRI